VARHGTIAGTHVRVRVVNAPIRSGEKSRLARASAALGQRAGGTGTRVRRGAGESEDMRADPARESAVGRVGGGRQL
jgi:hypothetical protein